ncbi:MAG: hypothetical protein KIT70_07230 [Anaerolineales bacterium]|nr:MAG: hypothetical protein KIT70_07230 [Anaerolineales bacterium]
MSTPATTALSTQAAAHIAAWYRLPQPGTLLLGGATRTDYVQRQTTNDVGLLSPQRAVPTVLTNPSARILEVFTLLQHGEHFLLLTQPGHAPGLAAYFKRHLFFNDQVTVEDASAAWTQLELYGPQVRNALASLGFAQQPSALDEVVSATWQDQALYAIQDEYCIRLLLPSALDLPADWAALPELDFASREQLRIQAGRAGDPEFTDANTPFEVGLGRYVSASKGCYTGQEVLARQVTYDKVARGLAQLSADSAMQPSASVSLDGRTIGQISSAAVSPTLGPLALAVLRKPFEPGQTVIIDGQPATIR